MLSLKKNKKGVDFLLVLFTLDALNLEHPRLSINRGGFTVETPQLNINKRAFNGVNRDREKRPLQVGNWREYGILIRKV